MNLIAYGPHNLYLSPQVPASNNVLFEESVLNSKNAQNVQNFSIETFNINIKMYIGVTMYSKPLEWDSDKIKLKSMIFTLNNLMSINEFKTKLYDAKLLINISGCDVYKFPLSLLMEIEPIKKTGNDITVPIPTYFMKQIMLGSLSHTSKRITLQNIPSELFSEINISTDNVYNSHHDRESLLQCNIEQFIPLIDTEMNSFNYNESNGDRNEMFYLNFSYCVKGYFIECDKLDTITNFCLMLNGYDRFTYDRTMLHLVGQRISPNLMYLPFMNGNNYKNMSRESYVGSCNHSRIDQVKVLLTFTNVQGNVKLKFHALFFNILRYSGGNGSVAFSN